MKRLLPLVLLVACGTSSGDDKLIEESLSAHESAMKSAEVVRKYIQTIPSSIGQCGDSTKLVISDSLAALREDLDFWESTITEIPGHEHNHHHGHDHDHDHDHSAPPNLTPQMVLEIQLDLDERAKKLENRADYLAELVQGCSSEFGTNE